MDYRQLQYFLQICETKNISSAADSCCITEQALSRSMHRLEEELGVTLLVRRHSGVELTASGEALREKANSYLAHHDSIVNYFQVSDTARPVIRLGVATGLLDSWLPKDFLFHYMQGHPEIDLEPVFFFEDSFNRGRQLYSQDLIICSAPVPGLQMDVVFHAQHRMRLLVSASSPLASRKMVLLSDLKDYRVGFSIFENVKQQQVRSMLRASGVEVSMTFGPSEVTLINQMIKNCGYVALFGGFDTDIDTGLAAVEVEDLDATWDLYILQRLDASLSPALQAFVHDLRKNLKQMPEPPVACGWHGAGRPLPAQGQRT